VRRRHVQKGQLLQRPHATPATSEYHAGIVSADLRSRRRAGMRPIERVLKMIEIGNKPVLPTAA
jgi:hypothetical protein